MARHRAASPAIVELIAPPAAIPQTDDNCSSILAIPPSSAHELSAVPELRSRDRTVLAPLDDLLSSSRRDARTREPFDWGDILHFGALKRSFTSLNRSFGTVIERTYCSISHRPPK